MKSLASMKNTLLFFCLLAVNSANADFVIRPASATADAALGSPGPGDFSVDNLIDLTLTPTAYTSGSTDAATYSANHTVGNFADSSRSNAGATGFVTFDLGAPETISEILVWNDDIRIGEFNSIASLASFELYADNNMSPSTSGTQLSTSSGTTFSVLNVNSMQRFAFTSTTTPVQYIHLNILSNHGSAPRTGFGEVAFVTVPEPSALLCVGFVCCAGLMRSLLLAKSNFLACIL